MKNRENKFRGYWESGKTWVYGFYQEVETEGKKYPYIFWQGFTTPVNHESVGEFTGLKDKNGKEVFEGDLCVSSFGDPVPIQIVFGEYSDDIEEKLLTKIGFYWDVKDDLKAGFGKSVNGDFDYFEVIGNIFENPELLT